MQIRIFGVHAVEEARQPCHLVELELIDRQGPLDVGVFCQPSRGGHEQAPWMEHFVDGNGIPGAEFFGEVDAGERVRIAFFIHYLEEDWRLNSPLGIIQLPPATPMPQRLKSIRYCAPD